MHHRYDIYRCSLHGISLYFRRTTGEKVIAIDSYSFAVEAWSSSVPSHADVARNRLRGMLRPLAINLPVSSVHAVTLQALHVASTVSSAMQLVLGGDGDDDSHVEVEVHGSRGSHQRGTGAASSKYVRSPKRGSPMPSPRRRRRQSVKLARAVDAVMMSAMLYNTSSRSSGDGLSGILDPTGIRESTHSSSIDVTAPSFLMEFNVTRITSTVTDDATTTNSATPLFTMSLVSARFGMENRAGSCSLFSLELESMCIVDVASGIDILDMKQPVVRVTTRASSHSTKVEVDCVRAVASFSPPTFHRVLDILRVIGVLHSLSVMKAQRAQRLSLDAASKTDGNNSMPLPKPGLVDTDEKKTTTEVVVNVMQLDVRLAGLCAIKTSSITCQFESVKDDVSVILDSKGAVVEHSAIDGSYNCWIRIVRLRHCFKYVLN